MGALTVAKQGYEGHLRLAMNQTLGFKAFGISHFQNLSLFFTWWEQLKKIQVKVATVSK